MFQLGEIYNKIEENLLFASLIFTVTVIFIQVVMRYVFSNSLSWSEEAARYVFIWQTWIGASYAVRKKRHLRVEVIVDRFQGVARKFIELVVLALWIVFGCFLIYKGYQLTKLIYMRGQISAALGISMAIPYAAIPVGSFFMTSRLVLEAFRVFKDREMAG
ncbi:MAG: Tripartite ATP-independent periplasmic transporter DctQ component [Synergistales bacterium 53_16]|nr:MAG: Tripartite ATP-independent periplasmic transporter DctQ component [Synergistales bacterium 53_16]